MGVIDSVYGLLGIKIEETLYKKQSFNYIQVTSYKSFLLLFSFTKS